MLPLRGFVWNDHAVASRGMALSELWYRYIHHQEFNAPVELEYGEAGSAAG